MKKILLSAMVAALVFGGSTTYGMSTDDIIQLCKAGFTPDRIAKIVDATGLDRPLAAADWARIRNDGCDDRVVDALLEVLVPADEAANDVSGDTPTESSDETNQASSNLNVYLRGNWGGNGWYGGFGSAWYDPFWSVGWNTWDSYWGWSSWGYPNYWYANDWWGYPYRHRFGFGPFYYHSNWYNGGYYSSGHHDRYKESRRRSRSDSYYADVKTPQTVQRGLVAKTVAFQASSTSFDRATGLRSKTVSPSSTTIRSGATATDRAYTTRSKGASRGTVSREALRSKGTGATVEGKSSTGATRYGTVKTRGATRTNPPSGGTGTDGNYGRTRTKSSGTTQSTPPATSTRQRSTPPPAGNHGGQGSINRGAGTPHGASQGTHAPRRKG